ncbi:hypothetical protein ABCS02_25980 [Microbacterium sp. X-17]|uniref:hypothetical protein n=1 Tax=Microbacterium sp. X-17 TaxID=3144404 RepID=UPI0031F5791C
MNTRTKSTLWIAAVAAALLAFAPATAATADSLQPTPAVGGAQPGGEEVRFGTTLEDSVLLGVAGQDSGGVASPNSGGVASPEGGGVTIQTIPFNPGDVAACNLANNPNWVIVENIHTFPYDNGSGNPAWSGGDVDLLCGTETTSGFKHIRDRHQWGQIGSPNGWETVRASASGALGYQSPQSWDEYMIHAVHDTLDYANPYPAVNQEQQKVCFSAPFHIWKGTQIYASYYANTVLSKSNYIVITAFLSNNSQASACNSTAWND